VVEEIGLPTLLNPQPAAQRRVKGKVIEGNAIAEFLLGVIQEGLDCLVLKGKF
jgi:hypothetical protein